MTDNSFPMVPPPELVDKWVYGDDDNIRTSPNWYKVFAAKAARWGADHELEACVEWLGDAPVVYNDNGDLHPGSYLRDARRPKPLSLKEQALEALDRFRDEAWCEEIDFDLDIVLRALEQLND